MAGAKLPEMLEYLSGKFLEVKLNTNATRLNEKLIRKVIFKKCKLINLILIQMLHKQLIIRLPSTLLFLTHSRKGKYEFPMRYCQNS